ncbi:hypothetical protein BHE90_016297 [Fusarium euwallaceae]|uniref:Uncharacterized protein n=1 Tax=Fusarium euwallaceae TaxID=1147111 RepID=A0A430L0R2_9HYPO|nr:hypothetical protein BHE90_016297 [Fusarium euwallaceae]
MDDPSNCWLTIELDMESTHSIRTYMSDAIVENLPPEVRHELLATLDLSSLRNMVHASPVYYRQYVLERRSILSLCLERTLGRTVLDAYWVYQTSRSSKFPSITNDETISNFRQAYMRQQASGSYSILRKSITENLAVGMAAFHYSTIDPILQLYIPHVLEALAEGTGGIVDQESLSQVEQARLIRGLYRFQLCCNLFTMANFPESSTLNRNGRKMRILTDYISLLEPWEIEEMGCIYSFANERFERVFEAVWRCTTRDDEIRRWGYVLWDAARLERVGAKRLLERHASSLVARTPIAPYQVKLPQAHHQTWSLDPSGYFAKSCNGISGSSFNDTLRPL